MRATLYKTKRHGRIDRSRNGHHFFELDELQSYVVGYIEVVRLPASSKVMIFNEDGKVYALPENHKATEELTKSLHGNPVKFHTVFTTIVGDAIVCERGLLR